MEPFHIGTSGWSYANWKGNLYPEGLKANEYLRFYAGKFSITEINTSFYHLPKEQTVLNWSAAVPPGFIFCPKLSRYITHMKKLNEVEEPMERFFNIFDKIGTRLGPVLVQLPWNVTFNPARAETFYKLVTERYGAYKFVMEVRHISWFEKDSLDLMRKCGIGLVISQSGSKFPYLEEVTAKYIYLRFHGPKELYSSPYSLKMLQDYAAKCLRWIEQGHEIWAFFNNTDRGYAFRDAATLEKLIRDQYAENYPETSAFAAL